MVKSCSGNCEEKSNLRLRLFEFTLFFQLFLVPFEVLNHEVLSGQLEVVPEMVDPLVWLQMAVVEDLIDGISLNPQDVPVFSVITIKHM